MKSAAALLLALLVAAFAAQAQTAYRWIGRDGKVNYSDQPPPAGTPNIEHKNFGQANFVDISGPSYGLKKAEQNFPVTLYSSADCGSDCRIARDFLKHRGIPFTEKIIRTGTDADAFKKATGLKEVAVPSLLVGTRVEKGYLKSAWNMLLDAAGYPGPEDGAAPSR